MLPKWPCHESIVMPRFSANLSFLFTELPFLDRFAAAATAGFRAVEFAFAYETPPREIAARVEDNGLALVLINTPPASAVLQRCPDASASSGRAWRQRSATRASFPVRASM